MDVRDLRYLAASVSAGNFGRAAKSRGLSASTVSRRVGRLEDELGLTLFERGHAGVRLTVAGRAVMLHVTRALAELDAVKRTGRENGSLMSSGHSLVVTLFADRCEGEIERLDPQLDDPAFLDRFHNDQPIFKDGKAIVRPPKPTPAWYFDDLKFGILDRRTKVFFCIYPFFDR